MLCEVLLMSISRVTIDGNEAVARIAYQTSEVIAIYPITPSSAMGEWADQWAASGQSNLWGSVPLVQEMQSEGGAAGAIHGALQTGALSTTFTASQGLLLMIPNMYKIAGELTPTVFHVAARSLAAQALSIFGDHSDVMAARATGFALLASGSVQEAMDLALIAHSATLKTRVPFLHFFDGFRTSHEISKVELVTNEQIRAMIDDDLVFAHRLRSLSPDRPVIRGTAQNPDVYFQARETVNPYYLACPDLVQQTMDDFGQLTGRSYHLFDYHGHPEAERVLVMMGSGSEAAHETIDHLIDSGERVGLVKVRLYRPFSSLDFVRSLPISTRSIAVLDRTKEPGSPGEPLYLDVVNALAEEALKRGFAEIPRTIGGRYGLSSKEFNPAMVKAVLDALSEAQPKNHFTVGIIDDVTHSSLPLEDSFSIEKDDVVRAVFFGLGSDGTVSANKNSIKIIGEHTDLHAQGYFVYDSKKAGSVTVSHLRFGPEPIRSTYLVERPNFSACHQFSFLERMDVLKGIVENGTFLLNSPYPPDETWNRLPRRVQEAIIDRKLKFYVIDAYRVARENGLGSRINTIMQTAFFKLSGILPLEQAVEVIKGSIQESYGKRGEEIVRRNFKAVDQALNHLFQVQVPATATSEIPMRSAVSVDAPDFVREVIGPMIAGRGDELPVSMLPCDGTYPVGTSKWEKRNIAQEIPVWDPAVCIQCNKCVMVCPHAVIRTKVFDPEAVSLPGEFPSVPARDREWEGLQYTLQVAPEDCTGCSICVEVCPARDKQEPRHKAINMEAQVPIRDVQKTHWEKFLEIPDIERSRVKRGQVRQSQLLEPLFEFSGACAGCGETPYIKLMTQLFGDRAVVANATGCSSIYGGNLPTTPWTSNRDGRGPAWSNSLFEDNAEFGLGMRLSLDQQKEMATQYLKGLVSQVGEELVDSILNADQSSEPGIFEQRQRVETLKKRLEELPATPEVRQMQSLADMLVKKSVWIIGGDGWAYDIGFGGLDHVLASGRDVNILVLDTEVYSNTGGQMSKSTPRAAVAKFSAAGKSLPKKDLGLMAMSYGHVYVASVAMGAKDEHTLKAFLEAEAYPGPSLIIAYSHCIAHGINMATAMENQKTAVLSGYWPLYRYNPALVEEGKNPLQLDSRPPKVPLSEYLNRENRFRMLSRSNPERARFLFDLAQEDVRRRYAVYEYLAAMPPDRKETEAEQGVKSAQGA